MALTPEEKKLVETLKASGKSSTDVMRALSRRRLNPESALPETTAASETQQPSGFAAAVKDIPSDLKEGFQSAVDSVSQGIETADKVQQNVFELKQSPLAGTFETIGGGLRAGAGAVGSALLTLGKLFTSPKTEESVSQGVSSAAQTVAQTPEVKALLARYEQLTPDQKGAVDGFLGTAEGLGTMFGLGPATKALRTGVGEVTDAAKRSVSSVQAAAKSLEAPELPTFTIPNASFAAQIGRDLVPKATQLRERFVARAFDLAPVTDLANIKKSTGNDVGEFLARNRLIKDNVVDTEKAIDDFYKRNYHTVRDAVSLVDETYSFKDLPEMKYLIDVLMKDFDGKKSAEFTDALGRLNTIKQQGGFSLDQAQEVKALFDQVESIYKRTGEVREALAAQDKANFINPVRRFIEDRVKENVGIDIRPLNNNTQTARAIADAIETRAGKAATAANLSLADISTLGFGTMIDPAIGAGALGIRKALASPNLQLRLARFFAGNSEEVGGMTAAELKEIEDLIREELKKSINE